MSWQAASSARDRTFGKSAGLVMKVMPSASHP
jgi:hypothetical protein